MIKIALKVRFFFFHLLYFFLSRRITITSIRPPGLQQYLITRLNVSQTKIKINTTKRKNVNYVLRYSGTCAKQILDFIYANTSVLTRCARKYKIYQNYLTSVSNSII